MKRASLASIATLANTTAGEAACWEVSGPLRPTSVQILEVRERDQLWRVACSEKRRLWWKRYSVPAWKLPLTLLQRSRSRREAAGLELLRQRDLPAPRVYACLEWHRHRMLHESALITHELPDAVHLTAFLRDEPDPERRAAACRAAGMLAAQLHRAGIGHFRFLAKNILIVPNAPLRAWVLDAPYLCAWRGMAPRAVRRFDLASLCSRAGELEPGQSEMAIQAYAETLDEDWEFDRLHHIPRWRLRFRRVSLYLASIWTGHRPDRWLDRPQRSA
ncbi:MAG: hypothetical protein O3A20_01930 [Planctomycetota bacterium]|nr:hypothetical protein [Planctomycetota bacterium]